MCSSGLSAVTAPMAITAGAAGVVWIVIEFLLNIISYSIHKLINLTIPM